MPERKVKAKSRPRAAQIIPALAAALALTACLSSTARQSALPPSEVRPSPAAQVLAEAPRPAALEPYGPPRPMTDLAPYGPDGPVADLAPYGSDGPVAGLILASAETPPLPLAPLAAPNLTEAGPGTIASTVSPPVYPDMSASPDISASYQPPDFVSGLIDRARLLADIFPDRILTAQAGARFLLANGLTPPQEDDLDQPELFSSLEAPLLDSPLAAPAPSAGMPTGILSGGYWNNSKGLRTTKLLAAAYEQTGRHYKPGGLSPGAGFDAAGYTYWVFSREGLSLPKTPSALAQAGLAVTKENLRPGDVLIYRNPADKVNGWHVGIYSGQGNFLHASPKAGVVTETDAFGPQYAPYFLSGRRFFDDPGASPLSDTQKMAATSTAVKLALAELGPNDKVVMPRPAPKPAKSKAKKAAKK